MPYGGSAAIRLCFRSPRDFPAAAPLVAEHRRDSPRVAARPRSQLARCLQAEMAGPNFAVAAGEHGNLEAELADGGAQAIHRSVVLARISGVKDQAVNRPRLDLLVW